MLVATGATFLFVLSTDLVVGGEYEWPTKVFGIVLALAAPLFVGATTEQDTVGDRPA